MRRYSTAKFLLKNMGQKRGADEGHDSHENEQVGEGILLN